MRAGKQFATQPPRERRPASKTAAASPAALASRLGNRNLRRLLDERVLQAPHVVSITEDPNAAGAQTLRRAPAKPDPECPGYERGEVAESRGKGLLPLPVATLSAGTFLVADFPVDSARAKGGMAADPDLHRWLDL